MSSEHLCQLYCQTAAHLGGFIESPSPSPETSDDDDDSDDDDEEDKDTSSPNNDEMST